MASILLLLVSCATADESTATPIDRGYRLSGLEAAAVYEEAIGEDPSYELYYNLAYSYLEAGDNESAVMWARKASELYPGMIRFDYLILYAYRESGRMYSYEKELERLAVKYPANDDVAEMLLSSYYGAKRIESLPVARHLLQRDPENAIAIRSLGEFYPFYRAISSARRQEEPESWDTGPLEIYNITKTLEDRLLT